MRKSGTIQRGRIVRFTAIFAAVGTALAVTAISAQSSVASTIAVTGVSASASTPNSGLGGAVPTVLVAAGGPFTLTVTLQPAGATFTKDTSLAVTASLASGGKPHGSFGPSTITMPAGVNSAQFSESYSAVDNGVIATVGPAKTKGGTSTITPGSTAPFDVLKTIVTFAGSDPSLLTGVAVGDASCTVVTSESECGTIVLSHGASSAQGALTLGACTPDLLCTSGGQVVQFIAGLSGYSTTDPALLIIRCAKTECPGKGVKSYTVKASFSASGPLSLVVQPCATKGVALDAFGNQFCTDYVQSHRDNAGGLLLYVLFVNDFRGSI